MNELDLHRHKFAAWAATRAASTQRVRLSGVKGVALLEKSGVAKACAFPAEIPLETDFDEWHENMCRAISNESRTVLVESASRLFSDGIAAKLLNVYMKALFIGGVGKASSIDRLHSSLHPPIDRLLLKALSRDEDVASRSFWQSCAPRGWTSLSYGEYFEIIETIRKMYPDGIWAVEVKYWRGYQ